MKELDLLLQYQDRVAIIDNGLDYYVIVDGDGYEMNANSLPNGICLYVGHADEPESLGVSADDIGGVNSLCEVEGWKNIPPEEWGNLPYGLLRNVSRALQENL